MKEKIGIRELAERAKAEGAYDLAQGDKAGELLIDVKRQHDGDIQPVKSLLHLGNFSGVLG